MENQIQNNPTNTESLPENQGPTKTPSPKNNKALIVGLFVSIFLLVCSTAYLVYQNVQLKKQISQVLPVVTSTPQPTKTNSIKFSEAITQFCDENNISLDKLPFILSNTLQEEYNIQESMSCYTPDENYANIIIQAKDIDNGDIGRTVYFFNEDSTYFGQGDAFRPLDGYHKVMINGQNYWVAIGEPGPFGISTLGIWVKLKSEKKDIASNTIVRSVVFKVFKNQEFMDLVIKYGEKQTDPISPEYIIKPGNMASFKDELVELAVKQNTFLELAGYVTSDLGGVSF